VKTVNSLINTSVDDARITLEGHLRANPTGAGIHATAGEGASVMIHLEPCPFCGQEPEQRSSKYNPYARCATPDCAGGKLPLISLDVPEDIERWNRRGREQALAAHVEGLRDAAKRYYNATCGEPMVDIQSPIKSKIDEANAAIEALESAIKSAPTTSLARRDAEQRSEGIHQAVCVLESEFDPCHPIIERLEQIESELRRQAKEPQS
jgi:hypothetical protein